MVLQLSDFPEWKQLVGQFQQLASELRELKAALPDWVEEAEAQRLTGHSRTTLYRERQNPHSLIKWKQDHGVKYERASLLAHNTSRAVRRGTSPTLSA